MGEAYLLVGKGVLNLPNHQATAVYELELRKWVISKELV